MKKHMSFNSRPHKEVDSGCPKRQRAFIFFQLTTSQGGRPAFSSSSIVDGLFQLTTSQGGRRSPAIPVQPRRTPFNSRPHKEVDIIADGRMMLHKPFNSRPHKEVDKDADTDEYKNQAFNSRPHKEVDSLPYIPPLPSRPFNSRPHKEVDAFR